MAEARRGAMAVLGVVGVDLFSARRPLCSFLWSHSMTAQHQAHPKREGVGLALGCLSLARGGGGPEFALRLAGGEEAREALAGGNRDAMQCVTPLTAPPSPSAPKPASSLSAISRASRACSRARSSLSDTRDALRAA